MNVCKIFIHARSSLVCNIVLSGVILKYGAVGDPLPAAVAGELVGCDDHRAVVEGQEASYCLSMGGLGIVEGRARMIGNVGVVIGVHGWYVVAFGEVGVGFSWRRLGLDWWFGLRRGWCCLGVDWWFRLRCGWCGGGPQVVDRVVQPVVDRCLRLASGVDCGEASVDE
ncbi:MAG: hypothetical protein JST42_07860 [Bacteroidetes bacterium]|nr:hypothetical protein [Bacteroidota bacterium]